MIDRKDTAEIAATLVSVTGSQDAAAEVVNASQSQMSGWLAGDNQMTPGYMALALRILFEADRRDLFIRQFYVDRLPANHTERRPFLIQENATVHMDTRDVTARFEFQPTAALMAKQADGLARDFITWSFHAAGDFFGFYRPREDGEPGIETAVFYVDLEDNTTPRGKTDPILRIPGRG